MYEIIIIGAGPAGITAAVYAARKKAKLLVITKDIGGQAAFNLQVGTYMGYQYITEPDLEKKLEDHRRQFNFGVKYEEVQKVEKAGAGFRVTTENTAHESLAVVVATGSNPRKLNVPGEAEFRNKGLTYCATCDAPLFSDRDVAVVGGGYGGLYAALQLERIANKIYLIESGPSLRGDEIIRGKVLQSEKVEVMTNTKVSEIIGDEMVKAIAVESQGKRRSLDVQGVFVEIGHSANSDLVSGLVQVNAQREIVVDNMCRTSAEGIFAAGDVTSVPHKQVVVAAGEGSKAALSAYEYVQRKMA